MTFATATSTAGVTSERKRRLERIRRRDGRLRRLLALADAIAVAIALTLSAFALGGGGLGPASLIAPFALVVVVKLIGLYDRDEHLVHKTTLEEVPAIVAISTTAALLLFLSGDLLVDGRLNREQVLAVWALLAVAMVVLRASARLTWRLSSDSERCLLVGNTSREQGLRETLGLNEAAHVELVGVMPITRYPNGNGSADLAPIPDWLLDELDIDRVIVAPGSHGADELMFVIRQLRDAGVKVSVLPDVSRLTSSSVELDYVGGIALLGMRRFAITRSSRTIKRAFDTLSAAALLLVLSPLIAAISVAIRIDSGTPILYRQRRVGKDGRELLMLKFRSMCSDADQRREELRHLDEAADGLFKIPEDPRVTRVGRWLRRTNLDELPQLINVVRGDMSLVGPRPLIPEEDRQVAGAYRRRLDVRPGITGHWQVLGSARVPLAEMVKLDYLYVANWSLWGDLVLLARTMPLILRRRGM